MSKDVKRPVELNEEQAVMIHKALHQYAKRCEQNSLSALGGYGKATSKERAEHWENNADEAVKLADYVLYEQSGV